MAYEMGNDLTGLHSLGCFTAGRRVEIIQDCDAMGNPIERVEATGVITQGPSWDARVTVRLDSGGLVIYSSGQKCRALEREW